MDINEIPRKYLAGFVVVIIAILVTITVANPGSLVFKDKTDYKTQQQLAAAEAKQYQALLDSVQPDYQASQQLLKKIATEDVVRQDVEASLDVKQPLVIPAVADADIKLATRNDKPAVVDYINKLGSMVTNYNNDTQAAVNQVFDDNADVNQINSAKAKTDTLITNLRGLPVPKDALEMQKAYLATYLTYNNFLSTASNYADGSNTNPWAKIYGQYEVINNRITVSKDQFLKLSTKYALTQSDINLAAKDNGFHFVNTAQAQFAVVDVQAAILAGIKIALARSFAKFATKMIDRLVAHIEKNFAIASQLYYSEDLGRYYSVEYMKKFVSDPVDQDIIQKFLPQYFCINPKAGELKQIFTAKARANQGSDIVIDPNDPHYLDKLAKIGGDEKNYPAWWEDYYSSLASTTQQSADAAATKEVISPGLKSGRDLITGQIDKTMSTIFNVQEAAISGSIQLGTSNSDNPVSQIVAAIVENMINKFVFTPIGAGQSSGGGIGVIGESNVCLRTPKIKPIAAIPTTESDPVNTNSTPVTPTTTGTPTFK